MTLDNTISPWQEDYVTLRGNQLLAHACYKMADSWQPQARLASPAEVLGRPCCTQCEDYVTLRGNQLLAHACYKMVDIGQPEARLTSRAEV